MRLASPHGTDMLPYLELLTAGGFWVPYQPTPNDLLANDWEVTQ